MSRRASKLLGWRPGALVVLALAACRDPNPAYEGTMATDALVEPDAGPSVDQDGPSPDAPPVSDAPPASDAPPVSDAPPANGSGSGAHDVHVLECEDGTLVGAMIRGEDNAAFGGAYAHVPPGPEAWGEGSDRVISSAAPDRIELAVTLERGGTYYLWVRFWALEGGHDAWYGGLSGGPFLRFFSKGYGQWIWTNSHAANPPGSLRFDGLSPGPHTVILGRAEAGPRCDRLVFTTDPSYQPPAGP